ncbi:hypothetical protein LPB248_08485 [Flavobacterium sp. LPB0248]|uniref:hypothetical protein n=1 Tax=Flavobacterium sp. LPB0248 TaxID=2614441 RepID=UPI0015A5ADD7|nr:hypothetical protein [Flavobacterium sp. LPB0248]QLC66318.1 hypothetical protein LPB248_08485 [Flavobacterium sp. LPB0248]
MKNLIVFLLISSSISGQNLDDYHLDLIKKNILTYRIFFLSHTIDSEYKFNYECLLPTFGWNLRIESEVETISFPEEKKYTFFKISNNNYSYLKFDSQDNLIVDKFDCGYIPFSEKFLIAINGKEILFISGMFFKSPISHFFRLDKKKPVTFLSFLNLKLYNYSIYNIKFKKANRKKIVFNGLISNETVTIEINPKNYDDIKVFYNNIKGHVAIK